MQEEEIHTLHLRLEAETNRLQTKLDEVEPYCCTSELSRSSLRHETHFFKCIYSGLWAWKTMQIKQMGQYLSQHQPAQINEGYSEMIKLFGRFPWHMAAFNTQRIAWNNDPAGCTGAWDLVHGKPGNEKGHDKTYWEKDLQRSGGRIRGQQHHWVHWQSQAGSLWEARNRRTSDNWPGKSALVSRLSIDPFNATLNLSNCIKGAVFIF